jgi:hypothetical protein
MHLLGSFKGVLKSVRKGLQLNTGQLCRRVFHNVFEILKNSFFQCSSHLRKEKMQQIKLDCLDMLKWRLGFGVSLHCFCSSVSLCGTNFAQSLLFRKSSCRIWLIVFWLMFNHPTTLWETIEILCLHFTETCNSVCILRVWRTPASWIILRSSLPSLSDSNHWNTCYGLWLHCHKELQHFVSFCWRYTQFKTELGTRSLLHGQKEAKAGKNITHWPMLLNCQWLGLLTPSLVG